MSEDARVERARQIAPTVGDEQVRDALNGVLDAVPRERGSPLSQCDHGVRAWQCRTCVDAEMDYMRDRAESAEAERDRFREAATKAVQAVISSGSGPAAPCFDEHDRAVESRRGKWYKVDGQAIDDLRAALTADAEVRS